MSVPEQVLTELLERTPARTGRAYRNFAGPAGIEIRAFVDGESRLPGISFRVARERVPAGMQLPRIRGASTTVVPDLEARPAAVIYELAAAQLSFVPVFVELAAQLLDGAAHEASASAALLYVARRVATWARFFDARGEEGLGRSAQLGLIGELLCMHRLAHIAGVTPAVESWTGPGGSIHDFQLSRGSIEAKLTTSMTPERFRITSERQLDDTIVPWLALFAVLAQESAAGTVDLPTLVDTARSLVSEEAPAATARLEERLLEAGYTDADRARYEVRVTPIEQAFLHVTGSFPRIRASELRPGVFGVAYDIPWSASAPYRITDEQVRSILSGAV